MLPNLTCFTAITQFDRYNAVWHGCVTTMARVEHGIAEFSVSLISVSFWCFSIKLNKQHPKVVYGYN